MANFRILQYPNLAVTGEVQKGLNHKSLSKEVKTDILETLFLLNENGTNDDFLGKRIEKTHRYKIWEMKFKDKSNTEWRILFKKISKHKKPAEYGLINMFMKTTPKLTKRDLDTAERIAKREGW